jgi:hypothetical protein
MTKTIEQAAFAAALKRMENDFYSANLPPRMWGAFERYLEHGISPGSFAAAVLSNDLRGAVERADDENIQLLLEYIRFLYNCVPGSCWGSVEKFEIWIMKGGFAGGAK